MPNQTFFVWAPYSTDSEALTRRSNVREAHLAGIKKIVGNGSLKLGGPTSDPNNGTPTGSMFIIEAENLAAVRAILEADEYFNNNVWDKERLNIEVITLLPIGQPAAQ